MIVRSDADVFVEIDGKPELYQRGTCAVCKIIGLLRNSVFVRQLELVLIFQLELSFNT